MMKDRGRLPVDADPGAGKAVIILCDILQQLAEGKIKRPLIVVPNSLVSQMASEVRSFTKLNPWVITTASVSQWKDGGMDTMFKDAAATPKNTVFITSYSWLSLGYEKIPTGQLKEVGGKLKYVETKKFTRPLRMLKELEIDCVFLDEFHMLRSESNMARAAATLAQVETKGFTGTLFPGNLADVLGSVGTLHSAIFGTTKEFLEEYSPDKTINSYHGDAPKKIRGRLLDFGTPQVRSTAWAALMPQVKREYRYVSFTPRQQKAYDDLLNSTVADILGDPKLAKIWLRWEKSTEGFATLPKTLLQKFVPLDQFLNAPALSSPVPLSGADAVSPKSRVVNEIASAHLSNSQNGKVLVLVQYKASAKNLFENLEPHLKAQAAYFEASLTDVLTRFADPASDLKMIIAVDKSIRVGHNLQAANCVIHCDTTWLPGDMRQREARSNRIKQTKMVHVYHVITKNSAEIRKTARNLSAEHIIAKANSNFQDHTQLELVRMTLKGMKESSPPKTTLSRTSRLRLRSKRTSTKKRKTTRSSTDFICSSRRRRNWTWVKSWRWFRARRPSRGQSTQRSWLIRS